MRKYRSIDSTLELSVYGGVYGSVNDWGNDCVECVEYEVVNVRASDSVGERDVLDDYMVNVVCRCRVIRNQQRVDNVVQRLVEGSIVRSELCGHRFSSGRRCRREERYLRERRRESLIE